MSARFLGLAVLSLAVSHIGGDAATETVETAEAGALAEARGLYQRVHPTASLKEAAADTTTTVHAPLGGSAKTKCVFPTEKPAGLQTRLGTVHGGSGERLIETGHKTGTVHVLVFLAGGLLGALNPAVMKPAGDFSEPHSHYKPHPNPYPNPNHSTNLNPNPKPNPTLTQPQPQPQPSLSFSFSLQTPLFEYM